MANVTNTPSPSASPPPVQGTNPWIIIIAVAVVICCVCFGILGLLIAFGPEIMHELGMVLIPVSHGLI